MRSCSMRSTARPVRRSWRKPRRQLHGGIGPRLTLIAVLLATASATTVSAQATMDALLRDTVLENGLHVIVVPNPTIPLATIQVTVRNGAFTQLRERELGVPHLLEHMVFRSFGKDGFAPEASKINASYNGTTSDETVTYYITLPSANLDRGMQLMANLMRAPRFDRADLESEQRVVGGELERSAADPEFLLSTMVNRRLWGDGFGRKNPIGNLITIQGATLSLLKEMYEQFYVPNNAALVITGDITAAEVFGLAGRHFSRWRRAADPFAQLDIPAMPALRSNQQVTVGVETNDVTLLVRWHGPSVRSDPAATYAADIFSSMVNDRVSGMQSRLVDSGLFQSVSLSYLTRAHVGPITIRATTTGDQLVEASAALRAELSLFSDPAYIDAELLEIAKKQQEVDWAMEMEAPSGLAWFVGDLWSVAGDVDYVRGYLDNMKRVQEPQIRELVGAYLADKPRVVGIMVSPATRRELGPRLQAAFAPWRQ
jgi:zinc protease